MCRNKYLSRLLAGLTLCMLGCSAMAEVNNSDLSWFMNLINANSGKTFCAPANAKIGELANAMTQYSKSHPEWHDKLTDQQAVQALSASYPCKVQLNAQTANTELSKLGAKSIEAIPSGEFASIDTKPSIAIMQKLNATAAYENDALVGQIVHDSGNFIPPVFIALANLYYRQGNFDNAIFWFNAGRLRTTLDALLCTDPSAASAVAALVAQVPKDLIKKQFEDMPKFKSIVENVLKWDASTAYSYDHRWISLHGMRAVMSGVSTDAQSGPLTIPRERWDEVAKQNRDAYRKSLDKAIETVQKARAESAPPSMSEPANVKTKDQVPVAAIGFKEVLVKLGDTIEQVKTAYQTTTEPEQANIPGKPGVTALRLSAAGTWFFFDPTGKVYTIRLETPFQGRVAGVSLGESTQLIQSKLGSPSKAIARAGFPNSWVYQVDGGAIANMQFNSAGSLERVFLTR